MFQNALVKAWEHERNLLEEGLILFHQTQQYYKEKLADVQSKLQRNIHTVLPFSNYELDQVSQLPLHSHVYLFKVKYVTRF